MTPETLRALAMVHLNNRFAGKDSNMNMRKKELEYKAIERFIVFVKQQTEGKSK